MQLKLGIHTHLVDRLDIVVLGRDHPVQCVRAGCYSCWALWCHFQLVSRLQDDCLSSLLHYCAQLTKRLWQHYRTVPSLYVFKLFGLELSSKAFNWVLALQVRLSANTLLTPAFPFPTTSLHPRFHVRPDNGLPLPHGYPPSPLPTPSTAVPSAQIVPDPTIPVQPLSPAVPPFVKQ